MSLSVKSYIATALALLITWIYYGFVPFCILNMVMLSFYCMIFAISNNQKRIVNLIKEAHAAAENRK